jgi:hypothetical protein
MGMNPYKDGFNFNASIVNQPGRWPALAVARLREVLGDPARWRPRMYTAPRPGITLGARGQYIEQLAIVPGSVVWGVSFATLDGSSASDYLIQVEFDNEGLALSNAPVVATNYTPTGAYRPVLLAEPKLLRTSAVSVKFWNTANAARSCEFLLAVAEPWHGETSQ